MDEDLKRASIKAAIKLGGGLLILCGFIGVRLITADPDGLDAEIAQLAAVEDQIATEAAEQVEAQGEARAKPMAEDSTLSRLESGVRERMPKKARLNPEADRLVSCQLGGGVQFMRAADCLTRGGKSKDFDSRR